MDDKNGVQPQSFAKKVFGAESNSAATISSGKLNKYSSIAIRMFHTGILTPKEMAYPAIAEFMSRMMSGITYYRTLYFVNVLKIDMTYVTLILTLIGIYDILNDPLMGIIYDKTRTRWGKARPYIAFASIPYFLSTAILYSGALVFGNSASDDPKKIIFVFVMLFIQETFSTIYSLPRNNMLTLMSPNPHDRISVGILNDYVGEIGAQIVYMIFLPLMELGNKGYINAPLPMIFSVLTCVTASLGCIANIMFAVNCQERILLQPKPAPITKTMFYVLKNKYALRNFIANFAVSWWSTGGYSWDVVTQQEIFGGVIPSMIAYAPYQVLQYLSITYIPKFQKLFKHDNKKGVLWLRFWDLMCTLGMTCFGIPFVDKKWVIVAIYALFYALNGVNNAPATVFEQELGREINDYTEYVTGERPDGTVGILTGLIMKVTSPINALLTVKLFKWSGYDTTINGGKMLPWGQGSKLVYQKVFFLFTGISMLPAVVQAIPYLFYDIEGEKREKMYIALNERRALLAEEHTKQDEQLDEIEELSEMLEDDKGGEKSPQ